MEVIFLPINGYLQFAILVIRRLAAPGVIPSPVSQSTFSGRRSRRPRSVLNLRTVTIHHGTLQDISMLSRGGCIHNSRPYIIHELEQLTSSIYYTTDNGRTLVFTGIRFLGLCDPILRDCGTHTR